MDAFLHQLRQNTASFYFLIIFAILWGGGMLWGIIFIFRSLGKRKRALKALREMHFESVSNNFGALEAIKEMCLKSAYRTFAKTVDAVSVRDAVRTSIRKNKILIDYTTQSEQRDFSMNIGLKEPIQIIRRKLVLSNLLLRPNGAPSFYAETSDTKTIRAYKPRKRIQSTTGWILCFPANMQLNSTIIVQPRFSGSAKFLMNVALKIAHLRPVSARCLLPEFESEFETMVANFQDEEPSLDTDIQVKILQFKDAFREGFQLHLDPAGVWITGSTWPDGENMKMLAILCGELTRSREI